MLAAHRDQENLVHSHQVPTKQAPKTPGARYPKTPLKQNDENAPTAFAGKTGLGGAQAQGKDKIMMTKGKGAATPMQPQSRAPLGAKTTNAKARNIQTPGVKGTVKGLEKSQLKPTTQKPKPKSTLQIEVKHDEATDFSDDEEPEYAPPRPTELPYESDVLPKGGLSFEGLKKENLFRGYYETFINPVDENGVSRQDRRFNDEMKAAMDKMVAHNERALEEITWNPADMPENRKPLKMKPGAPEVAEAKMARKVRTRTHQQQPSTIRSRKAAGVLSASTETQRKPAIRPLSAAASRRPLSTLIAGQKAAKPSLVPQKPTSTGNAPAEVASRTTIGYNKGKSASSAVHSHVRSQSAFVGRTVKTPCPTDEDGGLTITPARARQAGAGSVNRPGAARPLFMSIFDSEDEEDLPPINGPGGLEGEEEEEEFELKLDL